MIFSNEQDQPLRLRRRFLHGTPEFEVCKIFLSNHDDEVREGQSPSQSVRQRERPKGFLDVLSGILSSMIPDT
jgi:hypothetical protein